MYNNFAEFLLQVRTVDCLVWSTSLKGLFFVLLLFIACLFFITTFYRRHRQTLLININGTYAAVLITCFRENTNNKKRQARFATKYDFLVILWRYLFSKALHFTFFSTDSTGLRLRPVSLILSFRKILSCTYCS